MKKGVMKKNEIKIFLFFLLLVVAIFFIIKISVKSPETGFAVMSPPGIPISYYSFDEGFGSIAQDTQGNNLGTINGAVWTTGKSGNALSFDGVDDYVSLGTSSTLTPTTAMTISAWIKTNNIGVSQMIFNKYDSSGGNPYQLRVQGGGSGGNIRFSIKTSSEIVLTTTNSPISANQWKHVVGAWDGSTMKVYIDGVLVSPTASQTGTMTNTAVDARIGLASNGTQPFNGVIDEVLLYDRALTDQEIYSLFTMSSPSLTNDTTAPIVSISSPSDGTIVSSVSAITASASDNVGVVGVQFKLNGLNIGTEDTTQPYGISFDTTTKNNGTYTLTAVARDAAGNQGTSSSITITINNTVQTSFITTPPELPRVYVDTAMPLQTGNTIPVNAGGNLQTALNNAQPGDTIVLQAGATFLGQFTLPVKSNPNNKWIIVKTSAESSLPAQGQRVNPTYSQYMPKIVTTTVEPALKTVQGASYYRFIGVEVTDDGHSSFYGPALPGGGTGNFNYGLIALGNPSLDTQISQLTHHIVFDRSYIHGQNTTHVKYGIDMEGIHQAAIDSYISDIHGVGQDTQAIRGFNGLGPFKIVNNHLEAAGENILFGGADPVITGLVPSDVEIRNNYIYKPLSWKIGNPSYVGIHWSVKNLFETKNMQRVLFEGNVLENSWPDGQTGFGFVLKSANQNGGCSWCVSQDLTIRNNIMRSTANGASIHGLDAYNGGGGISQRRVLFENNLFENAGYRLFQLTPGFDGAQQDIQIIHNTVWSNDPGSYPGAVLIGDTTPIVDRLVINNNVLVPGLAGYSVIGSGAGGWGKPSLDYYAPGWVMQGNALLVLSDGINAIPNNIYTTRTAGGFVNPSAGNFALTASSPLKGTATDGKDPGADIPLVLQKTAGAVSGNWSGGGSPPPVFPSDTMAPIATITTPTANQQLPAGTTQTTLSVTTNELAICKFSTTNQIYDNMSNTFTTTGTTSHSTILSGLSNGQNYTYYVRCQDSLGNKNNASATISFSVNVSVPVCDLTSASWNKNSTLEGDIVYLNIFGNNCSGKTISFDIKERDIDSDLLGGDDPVQTNPLSVVFNGSSTSGTWIAEWQDDGLLGLAGDPEYYFTASVVGTIESIKSGTGDSELLHVFKTPQISPVPTVTLSANPTSITSGQSSTLTWSSTNATSCSALWTSSTATSGTQLVSPTTNTTYSLSCTGDGGVDLKSVTITVNAQVVETVTTNIPQNAVLSGLLVWTASPSGFPSRVEFLIDNSLLWTEFSSPYQFNGDDLGRLNTSTLSNGAHQLKVKAVYASSTAEVVVNVNVLNAITASPVPTVTLSASPTSITLGQSSTLTWSSTNATSCSASNGWTGTKSTSGNELVSPTVNTTYSLMCTGNGGSSSQSTTVGVLTLPPILDTSAPIATINAPGANQIFPAGTTSTTLAVTTNEIATCKYSSIDESYNTMLYTLNGAGTISHTATITNLQDGTSYIRYIRCRDVAENAMTSSKSVGFSVAQPLSVCGDNTCNLGETSSSCIQDCPTSVCGDNICNSTETSTSCSVDCPAFCDLTSASWNRKTAVEGETVYLNVNGNNCIGKTISFEVREYDIIGNDFVQTNPLNVIFSGNSIKGSWIAEWQAEGIGESNPPEYYFTATVVGTNEKIKSKTAKPKLLYVNRL